MTRVPMPSAVAVMLLALVLLPPAPGRAQSPCGGAVNPIACENAQPGNPASEWDVGGEGSPSIQGFATDISVNRGETVRFKINTGSTSYRLDIYRMGYYGGLGARRVATAQPAAPLPQKQPACLTVGATGLIDCGNWSESAAWAVPAAAVSGIYFAKLVRQDGTAGASHIVFVVRDDLGNADLLFQTSDTTWQAYNSYGGNSLYTGSPAGRAYKVSYNRPFRTRATNPEDWVFNAEYPMVRWLERNGYHVSYFTGVDSDRRGEAIRNHRVFLSVGHDEYWSAAQRAHVEAARDAGVHLAFFSGNEVFWKTRWESSIDASGTPHRTLVCYKETHANARIDPLPDVWTGTWRDPRFSPPADGGRPENRLTGTLFTVNDGATTAIRVPEADGKLRFWRHTSVATLAPGATATLSASTLGYEWDEDVDNGFRPPGLIGLSRTTVNVPEKLLDHGTSYGPGTATHRLTLYRADSGALVFGAGTVQWSWGLDGVHDRGGSTPDPRMQQATVNLLADMGVQPQTLQGGLVQATGSTDTAPPTSAITSPASGATVTAGTPVTITGTATDAGGGVVAAVEVSVDGGATWRPATGRASWSFTWTPAATGGVTLRSSAADDSGNVETPSAGVTVTVGGEPATCPCSLWSAAATPSLLTDPDTVAVELGVKFRASVAGVITALRFYKGPQNTGTHAGKLWTSTGTLLASVTFADETASGWQQQALPSPVPITATTVYVASYHTGIGRYSVDEGYFVNPVDRGPLHAPAASVSPNGVYRYGASGFPTQTYNASNYWVDVVFTPSGGGGDTTPPTVTATSPAAGATGVAVTASVTATFSEAMDPATITTSTFELRTPANALVEGAVTYDGATRVATLDPAASLVPSTTYTVTVRGGTTDPRVKDLAGNALASSLTWSFTTAADPGGGGACPCTLFASTATPAVVTDTETQAVELGVKFRSDLDGFITGIRFYKGAQNTGTHRGRLWTSSGTLLADVTFTGETASGWQQASFPSPVAITANTTYVASYHAPNGRYSIDLDFFAAALDRPPLHAPASSTTSNGVYLYGGGGFPTQTFRASNYWVDVVFTTSTSGGGDTTPPTVTATSPAAGATAVAVTANVTATFSEAMDPATITTSTFQLHNPATALVEAAVTYDAATRVATLDPAASLAASTTYTATVRGGTTDPRVKDLAGNALASSLTWSFTTAADPGGDGGTCPCTIWPDSATPGTASADDGSAVELGVKFRSEVDGFITAIRFYKGALNTGTHVGNLWTITGTLLGSVTFTGETASGWQQATLPSAVPIGANTVYVASYHTTVGRYAFDGNYFGAGVDRPPLHALANSASPNGVYRYGASGFPAQSFNASNYWVDVVFTASAPPDSTPPTVTAVAPPDGATAVSTSVNPTATFSEAMDPATITATTFLLRDGGGALVEAAVTYDATARRATLDPASALAPATTYTATVRGGGTDPRVKDLAGNALAASVTWSFTTAASPPPGGGPGGPVLVVTASDSPFSRYHAEILRTEGLNALATADIGSVTAAGLAGHDVVLLAEMPLTPAQVTMFTDWVTAGGKLIAMRPDKALAPLLGLADAGGTLSGAYLLIDTSAPPGAGLVDQTIQFQGAADRYTLDGATRIATLYSSATASTVNPAVTVRSVGTQGGQAAAFTYDLARSIVYSRQGNPAWAGQERDGLRPMRSDDLFFGNAAFDPQPDWIDLSRVAIPQADEQQRLLANLILHLTRDRMPLPRFWYFPRDLRAVVVMTGDDHGNGGTAGRFDGYLAASPPGCSVDDWQCIRGTSYMYTDTPLSNAQAAAYAAQGFEIALHINTACGDWTPAQLAFFYADQLAAFSAKYASLQPPATHRLHCIVWSDWVTQPRVSLTHEIGLDVNYYYWPPAWVADRPGFFTGSGMPMRFADVDGTIIDVYHATTQMTDESGQSYPFTVNTLLDRALGPQGYYGFFVANMHTDDAASPGSDAIVASAKARGVPVITARQLLAWLDGRNGSTFGSLAWSAGTLSFTISAAQGANGLQAMLPHTSSAGTVTSVTRNGVAVPFTMQTIKGVQYAVFPALGGAYDARYASP